MAEDPNRPHKKKPVDVERLIKFIEDEEKAGNRPVDAARLIKFMGDERKAEKKLVDVERLVKFVEDHEKAEKEHQEYLDRLRQRTNEMTEKYARRDARAKLIAARKAAEIPDHISLLRILQLEAEMKRIESLEQQRIRTESRMPGMEQRPLLKPLREKRTPKMSPRATGMLKPWEEAQKTQEIEKENLKRRGENDSGVLRRVMDPITRHDSDWADESSSETSGIDLNDGVYKMVLDLSTVHDSEPDESETSGVEMCDLTGECARLHEFYPIVNPEWLHKFDRPPTPPPPPSPSEEPLPALEPEPEPEPEEQRPIPKAYEFEPPSSDHTESSPEGGY